MRTLAGVGAGVFQAFAGEFVGRYDTRAPGERRTKVSLPETRTARLLAHTTAKAVSCACVTKFPAECLCCGRIVCLRCAGLINVQVDLAHYFPEQSVPADAPFNDPLW